MESQQVKNISSQLKFSKFDIITATGWSENKEDGLLDKNKGGSAEHSPVHGELGHQGDVSAVGAGLVLVVEEVEVSSVDGESLPTKLVARIILV